MDLSEWAQQRPNIGLTCDAEHFLQWPIYLVTPHTHRIPFASLLALAGGYQYAALLGPLQLPASWTNGSRKWAHSHRGALPPVIPQELIAIGLYATFAPIVSWWLQHFKLASSVLADYCSIWPWYELSMRDWCVRWSLDAHSSLPCLLIMPFLLTRYTKS